MSDKKKIKYLSKVQKVAGFNVTLYSIDGSVWSSRRNELVEIMERHERERTSFGGDLKGQSGGNKPFAKGGPGRPVGRPKRTADGEDGYKPQGDAEDEDGAPALEAVAEYQEAEAPEEGLSAQMSRGDEAGYDDEDLPLGDKEVKSKPEQKRRGAAASADVKAVRSAGKPKQNLVAVGTSVKRFQKAEVASKKDLPMLKKPAAKKITQSKKGAPKGRLPSPKPRLTSRQQRASVEKTPQRSSLHRANSKSKPKSKAA